MKKKKHLLRVEKSNRRKANREHRTYQSSLESDREGWMKQHVVNKILGMFGGF